MSVRSMARVWESSQHAGTELLMLLAIADFSDDAGNSYPAVATLATKCRMKPRNCQYILRSLEQSGELSIETNRGPAGSNLYRINFDALGVQHIAEVQSVAGVQQSARRGATHCAKGVQPVAYKPPKNYQEPSTRVRETKTTSRFDAKTYLLELNVAVQIADDWLSLRKAKRAAPTKTAMEGIRREAEKAGISLGDALAISCERGWQGFRADWLSSQHGNASNRPTSERENVFAGAL